MEIRNWRARQVAVTLCIRSDVANLSDLDRLYETVRASNARIDVLFANAGGRQSRAARRNYRGAVRFNVRYERARLVVLRMKAAS